MTLRKQNLKQIEKNKHKLKRRILKKSKRFYQLNTKFKYKNYLLNSKLKENLKNKLKKKIVYTITIKIIPNNVFCTFINNIENKTKLTISAGKYKLNVSRKKLKFTSKIILAKFIDEIKNQIKNSTILIKIYSPIKQKKSIIKKLISSLKKNKLIIKSLPVKCFNGCRPKKKKRKKQKGLRIFK
jgi:ribosomal protein S11